MVQRAPQIELEIQGRPGRGALVPLRTFARAAESLTELLAQVTADRPMHVKVDFYVSDLRKGSAVLKVEGREASAEDAGVAQEIMRSTVAALATLQSGSDVRGAFSYSALEKARALGNLLSDGAGSIVVRGFGQEVPITATGAERAKAILSRRFHSYGSVEGTIETVSIHEARPYFNVFHPLDGHAIKCRCDAALLTQAKAVLGSRVRVVGSIERRFDGRAEAVDAAEFRVLRTRDLLPQVAQVRGLLAEGIGAGAGDPSRGAHG